MGNGVSTLDSEVSIHKVTFTIEKPSLSNPKLSLDYENNVLSWQNVENATSYEVYINDVLQDLTTSPFDLSSLTDAGEYTLKVVAIADGYKSSEATIKYIVSGDVDPLDAPTNFNLDGFILTWDEVEGAVGYKIIVNGVVKESSNNSFDLSQFDIGNETVTVTVIAIGNIVDYSDSEEASYDATLPELLQRLDALALGDFVSTYLLDGVDAGHRKIQAHKNHPIYSQAGWNGYIRLGIKVNGEMIYQDYDFNGGDMQMIHTPNSTDSFFGRNLPSAGTVELHIILVGDNVTARDSSPLITTMNWKIN